MILSESHPEGESTSSLFLKVKVYRGLHSQFLLITDTVSGIPVRSVTFVVHVDLSKTQSHVSRQVRSLVTSQSETFAAVRQPTNEIDQSLLRVFNS